MIICQDEIQLFAWLKLRKAAERSRRQSGVDKTKKPHTSIEQNNRYELLWYNIAEAYENNKLKWRKSSGDWQTLTFPDEMSDYDDIKGFLQTQTGFVDQNSVEKKGIFDLDFNFTINRDVITIAKDYKLDRTEGGFTYLIGYEKTLG